MSRAERHVYSMSNVEKEEYESEIEIQLCSSDWKLWKLGVDKNMRNLSERLSALERKRSDELASNRRCSQSFTIAREDGFSRLRSCALLIRSNKVALLQCIWLIGVLIIVLAFGIIELSRARDNISAEFKPAKKVQTVDYTDSKSDEQYEMPYIYLMFGCYSLNDGELNDDFDWSHEEINETLTYLLESQSYFQNSTNITYLDEDINLVTKYLPTVEAKAFYLEQWNYDNNFWSYFRLHLADPDPFLGSFRYTIHINPEALTRNRTLWINGFWVSVARDMSNMDIQKSIYVPCDRAMTLGSSIYAEIHYDEKVLRKWREGYVNYFTSMLQWYSEDNNDDAYYETGEIEILFRGNLMIEYWEEYVAYGYYDWISSFGGMLSICSLMFFVGANFLVKIFGEKNIMGILPGISFVYSNVEKIHILKERVMFTSITRVS